MAEATAKELDIDTGASAMDMADALFGDGILIKEATYTGANSASGIYKGADETMPGVAPSDSGVILSTGKAESITNSSGDVNKSSGTSTNHKLAGDNDLTAIAGSKTYDAAILEADFIPVGETLTMQLSFSSEEYLEYVGSGFNDAVGVFVNGQKAELALGDGDITINNINDKSNSNLYKDNSAKDDTYNTEMDGLTVTLTLKAPVEPGELNHIKIAIADGGDGIYDSNLMIAGDSIQTSLIADDDSFKVEGGDTHELDVLSNDASSASPLLKITSINGEAVEPGQSVELPNGDVITLTEDGTLDIKVSEEEGSNLFTYTVTDGAGNTDSAIVDYNIFAPCFVAGAMIDTPRGKIPVEALKPGDPVHTLDHGVQTLRWVGRSVRPSAGRDAPVSVGAGALGYAHEAFLVSQQHRLLLRSAMAELYFGTGEVLVKAKDLVTQPGIRLAEAQEGVCYVHLLFDSHEIIIADGAMSESYHPGMQTLASFDAGCRDEVLRLFPSCDPATGTGYGPAARLALKGYESAVLMAS